MSALDELRENLREAARRDTASKRVRRRRQRFAGGFAALALIGGSAAAGATDLISVGEPVEDLREHPEEYRPPPGSLQRPILATARSGRELPYGVASYDDSKGRRCLIVGSLRGYTLGREVDGKFRPYKRNQVGLCQKPELGNQDHWPDAGNTVLFGRAPAHLPVVRVTAEGKTFFPLVQKDRTFIVVFKGKFAPGDWPGAVFLPRKP